MRCLRQDVTEPTRMAFFRRRIFNLIQIVRAVCGLIVESKIVFLLGFSIGVTLAVLVHFVQNPDHVLNHFHLIGLSTGTFSQPSSKQSLSYQEAKYDFAYEKWLSTYYQGAVSEPFNPDFRRYTNKTPDGQISNKANLINKFLEEKSVFDPRSEADFLYTAIPVICIVFPTDLDWTKAVGDTWGKHCNEIRFFSHEMMNKSLEVEFLKASSSFSVVCQSFLIVWEDYKEKYESFWVFVATQDTFVLLENFRYYVAPMNKTGEYYLGHAMRFWNSVYNWADAGYAVSSAALKRLLDTKFQDVGACEAGGKYFKNGDWYLGRHLAEIGIKPQDTRDHAGRGRFNGYSLKRLLFPGGVSLFERYWKDSLYLSSDGPHCCSNFAVTFHGIVSKSKMYQLEYLYYHLIPFHGGGEHGNAPPPTFSRDLKAPSLTWEEHLKEEAMKNFGQAMPLLTTPKNFDEIMAASKL